jgi:simple sugar transport system ATP-binding protein
MGVVHAHKTTKEELGLMMTGALDLNTDKVAGIAKDSLFENTENDQNSSEEA